MKLAGKILYGLTGLLLVAAVAFTGEYGLARQDSKAYKKALELQPYTESIGFRNFRLADYPVAFFSGTKEYVLYKDETATRKPVLGNLAATTWKVNGRYEILIPTYKDMEKLLKLTAGLKSKHRAYGMEEHASTIWHEAFHAWHMTNFESALEKFIKSSGMEQAPEENEWQPLDGVPARKLEIQQEMELLAKIYHNENEEEIKKHLKQYFALRNKRLDALPEYIKGMEDFYELSEGGATYVESQIYLKMMGAEMYNEKYIAPAGEFARGNTKYYRTGLLKYLLMDRLNPGWQAGFDSNQSVNIMLEQALNGG